MKLNTVLPTLLLSAAIGQMTNPALAASPMQSVNFEYETGSKSLGTHRKCNLTPFALVVKSQDQDEVEIPQRLSRKNLIKSAEAAIATRLLKKPDLKSRTSEALSVRSLPSFPEPKNILIFKSSTKGAEYRDNKHTKELLKLLKLFLRHK